MTTYNPDYWIVVKLTPVDTTKQPHYRVFASWAGSYLGGASWKMNSGITAIRDCDDHYEFDGSSGSVYSCHKSCYGTSGYGAGVLQTMIEDSKGFITIEQLDDETDFMNLEYN